MHEKLCESEVVAEDRGQPEGSHWKSVRLGGDGRGRGVHRRQRCPSSKCRRSDAVEDGSQARL